MCKIMLELRQVGCACFADRMNKRDKEERMFQEHAQPTNVSQTE